MKKRWMWVVGGAALTAAFGAGACGDDDPAPPTTVSCQPTDPACPALAVSSDCLALTDNTGKDVFAVRLAQLVITAPAALSTEVVYNIIGKGVNADLPACNLFGDGTFNFIVEFDKANGTLKAGGALPEADPTDGYCFVTDPTHEVEPVTVPSNLGDDGGFSTDPIPRIVVPIYLDQAASGAVYLPLRDGRIESATLSGDQNCVGRYNAEGLRPEESCAPLPQENRHYFVNGGKLTGYITLEEADAVDVDLTGESLCVLLSGDSDTYGDGATSGIVHCKRENGEIVLKGDWCSQTNSAGGCQDAFRLEGEIAASAVTLRDDCPADPGTGGGPGAGGMGSSAGAGGGGGGI